jgi:polyferredoxin
MVNRKGMVVGFERVRARDCANCYSACDHVCPMRLHPRSVKRLMFACVQCGQCLDACAHTQAANPRGPLLHWVTEEAAQWESAFNAHLAAERDRRPAGSCAAVSNRTCHACNGA